MVEQEANLADSLKLISRTLELVGISANITSGTVMTPESFKTKISKAGIVHFHAHVDSQDLKQHLILEKPPEGTVGLRCIKRIVRSQHQWWH